jgi:excisionase family DNA binding protein
MANDVQARRLLTLAQTAERMQISIRTVRRRIEDGSIPAVRLGTRAASPLRIPEASVLANTNRIPGQPFNGSFRRRQPRQRHLRASS